METFFIQNDSEKFRSFLKSQKCVTGIITTEPNLTGITCRDTQQLFYLGLEFGQSIIGDVGITKEEAKIIFSWLSYKAHEVNVDESDIELLKKIEPLLPKDYVYCIGVLYKRYKDSL